MESFVDEMTIESSINVSRLDVKMREKPVIKPAIKPAPRNIDDDLRKFKESHKNCEEKKRLIVEKIAKDLERLNELTNELHLV